MRPTIVFIAQRVFTLALAVALTLSCFLGCRQAEPEKVASRPDVPSAATSPLPVEAALQTSRQQDASAGVLLDLTKIPSDQHAAIKQLVVRIDGGGPFRYRQDDRPFQNRERRLPRRPAGFYREYTVDTPGSRDRGTRRIISGRDGQLYYTDDHYRTFTLVRGAP